MDSASEWGVLIAKVSVFVAGLAMFVTELVGPAIDHVSAVLDAVAGG